MLAVVTLIVAQMADTSLRLTRRAIEEERIMRHRWALNSLRFFLLDENGSSLDALSAGSRGWTPETVQLNAVRYEVLLASESSKLPLARLAANRPRQEVRELLRYYVRDVPGVSLRPEFGASEREPRHWDAVFWNRDPFDAQWPVRLRQCSGKLSLWSERLDIVRAGDDEVDWLWRSLVGHTADESFHAVRRSVGHRRVRDMLRHAGLTEANAVELESWVTNRPEFASLWIHARGTAIHDDYFFVRGTAGADSRIRAGFAW